MFYLILKKEALVIMDVSQSHRETIVYEARLDIVMSSILESVQDYQ